MDHLVYLICALTFIILLSLFINPSYRSFEKFAEELTDDQKAKIKYADKLQEYYVKLFFLANKTVTIANKKYEQGVAYDTFQEEAIKALGEKWFQGDTHLLRNTQKWSEGFIWGKTGQEVIDEGTKFPERHKWIDNALIQQVPYTSLEKLVKDIDIDMNFRYLTHRGKVEFSTIPQVLSQERMDYADALMKLIIYTWISALLEEVKSTKDHKWDKFAEIYYKKWVDFGITDEDDITMGLLPYYAIENGIGYTTDFGISNGSTPLEVLTKFIANPNKYKYISKATMDRHPLTKIQNKIKDYEADSSIILDNKYLVRVNGKLKILPLYSDYVKEALHYKICLWQNTFDSVKLTGTYNKDTHSTLYEKTLKENVFGNDAQLAKLLTFEDISTKVSNGQNITKLIENTIINIPNLYDFITDDTVVKFTIKQLQQKTQDTCSTMKIPTTDTTSSLQTKDQAIPSSSGSQTTAISVVSTNQPQQTEITSESTAQPKQTQQIATTSQPQQPQQISTTYKSISQPQQAHSTEYSTENTNQSQPQTSSSISTDLLSPVQEQQPYQDPVSPSSMWRSGEISMKNWYSYISYN